MKDHEIQRIADKVTQTINAKTVVNSHISTRKTQRYQTGFANTRQTGYFAARAKKMH